MATNRKSQLSNSAASVKAEVDRLRDKREHGLGESVQSYFDLGIMYRDKSLSGEIDNSDTKVVVGKDTKTGKDKTLERGVIWSRDVASWYIPNQPEVARNVLASQLRAFAFPKVVALKLDYDKLRAWHGKVGKAGANGRDLLQACSAIHTAINSSETAWAPTEANFLKACAPRKARAPQKVAAITSATATETTTGEERKAAATTELAAIVKSLSVKGVSLSKAQRDAIKSIKSAFNL